MATLWGIHTDPPELDHVGQGFISVGWDEIGDLQQFHADPTALKARIAAAYPDAKPGAIPVWAGVLNRFAFGLKKGDFIVSPNKADSTLNFGRVTGDYEWHGNVEHHGHRRTVEWLRSAIPRAQFSQSARYEIGSAVTLFMVRHHADEFLAFINSGVAAPVLAPGTDEGQQPTPRTNRTLSELLRTHPTS